MRQVITIAPDGIMSGLQVKPGKGLDLTKFGPASVKRASEIVWDEDAQAWKIDVLQEVGKGVLTFERLSNAVYEECGAGLALILSSMCPSGWDHHGRGMAPMTFAAYDEAVKVEIMFLDALRLKGQF